MVSERERYELHYERNSSDVLCLQRYELKAGYKLFEIVASYSANLGGTHYYIVEKNQRAAKKLFTLDYPWLDKIKGIRECTEDESETILSSPGEFIII